MRYPSEFDLMIHSELIDFFPVGCSIPSRVVLVSPVQFRDLLGQSVHDCRMFLLVVRGNITIRKHDLRLDVEANQFIDILAWEPIYFESMSRDVEAWCLLPNYLFTNEALNGMRPADSESFKDRYSIPMLNLTPSETRTIETQLTLLYQSLGSHGHAYRIELCRSYFRNFMLETGNIILHKNSIEEPATNIESRQDWITRNFLKLVWRHYKTERNVSFYATALCLSDKHLARVVKANLGKTPYAVIRDELLQRATYLLKETKVSIQEISSELSFSEMAAFCKFFKKHTGLSPTAFRNSSPTD